MRWLLAGRVASVPKLYPVPFGTTSDIVVGTLFFNAKPKFQTEALPRRRLTQGVEGEHDDGRFSSLAPVRRYWDGRGR